MTAPCDPLPAGINLIRLVARDAAGRTASAQTVVVVGPIARPYLTLRTLPVISPRARTLKILGGAALPATLTIGPMRFQLGQLRPITMPIHLGRTPVVFQAAVTAEGITTPFAFRVFR